MKRKEAEGKQEERDITKRLKVSEGVDGDISIVFPVDKLVPDLNLNTSEEIKESNTIKLPSSTLDEEPKEEIQAKTKRKIKFTMITGYNGREFAGSQIQNEEFRTVERDLESALHEADYIPDCNFRNFKKISFGRATRTDRGVHALQNSFTCKMMVEKYGLITLEEHRKTINEHLPKDIHVFGLCEVKRSFNPRTSCSYREYLYYLPSFCLCPIQPSQESLEPLLMERKLTEEELNKVQILCTKFEGTHKYHNYTRNMLCDQAQAKRFMMNMEASVENYGGIEYLKFFLRGQSFLYNQIRKMIGAIILISRNQLTVEYLENSLKDNVVDIPLAPPNGLILNRVSYDSYNKYKSGRRMEIDLPPEHIQKLMEEIEEFKMKLIEEVSEEEKINQPFAKWLKSFDEKYAEYKN